MKKFFILFALMTLVAASAFAQKTPTTTLSKETDIQAIERMEKEISAGFLKGNADAHDKYVSQNLKFTAPDGMRLSRDDLSAAIRSGMLKFTSSTISNMKVTIFGDTAIVNYDTDDKGTFNGTDISGKARWTDTWARIDGKWLCVAVAGANLVEMPTK